MARQKTGQRLQNFKRVLAACLSADLHPPASSRQIKTTQSAPAGETSFLLLALPQQCAEVAGASHLKVPRRLLVGDGLGTIQHQASDDRGGVRPEEHL